MIVSEGIFILCHDSGRDSTERENNKQSKFNELPQKRLEKFQSK
jgi:hypothetical protein